MKRFICMSLTVLMLLFSVTPAFAADKPKNRDPQGTVTPLFTHISSLSAGLTIDSSGKATSTGNVTLYNNSYSTELTVQLQRYASSGWSTIKSWTSSGTGIPGTEIVAYYYVTRGTYRVLSTAKVYDTYGYLVETQSQLSATVTY